MVHYIINCVLVLEDTRPGSLSKLIDVIEAGLFIHIIVFLPKHEYTVKYTSSVVEMCK